MPKSDVMWYDVIWWDEMGSDGMGWDGWNGMWKDGIGYVTIRDETRHDGTILYIIWYGSGLFLLTIISV